MPEVFYVFQEENSMRIFRIPGLVLFVFILLMFNCSGPESDKLVLTTEIPFHLEEHREAARIEGSEKPQDLPTQVEWRFDEPQPGWKVTPPRPFPAEIRPATVSQTDVALRIILGSSTANPNGRLVGGAFIEVPEWAHRDWAYVIIQARSSGPCNIRLGFNVWDREGHPNEGRPNPYEMWGGGPLARLVGDSTVRTFQLPAEPQDSWEEPIRQLGLWIGAGDPLEVEILSITVVPMDVIIGEGGIPETQEQPDDDAIWKAFISWFRSAPKEADPVKAYTAKLGQEGVPETEIRRRGVVIVRLFSERTEGVETFFDWAYSQPIPAEVGFSPTPTAFLVDVEKGMKPGVALDVGMGQGRNAVFLASEGWDVTGMDISQIALDEALANADKSGVSIRTEKAAYDTFDFGVNKWDLIVIVFAWAPVSDTSFVDKLRTSLRPGGAVLFEHFIGPMTPMIRALKPNELKTFFADFDIKFYEEAQGTADWGGPKSSIVRMLARKRSRDPHSSDPPPEPMIP
jgi:SAM-dependent methyltransferase